MKVGDTIRPPHDTVFSVLEVDEDEKTILIRWEQDGRVCQCWAPMSEFAKPAVH